MPAQPQSCNANKICYFKNANDAVGGMDVLQTISSTVTLWPSNFSRDGYGFAGWSTTYDYSDPTGFYGPMETISLNTSDYATTGLSLYAHWVPAETGVTMQTFNPNTSPYSTKLIGTVIALKDARDNDTYAVAKLADGKWWMIENLRLDYDANITPANTQSNNGSFGGVFIGLAEAEGPWVDGNTAANSLYTTEIDIPDKNTISGNNLDYRFPRYNNDNTSSRVSGSSYSVYRNVYSYGNYYTWAAAAADTSDYVSSGQSAVNTSICPNGWGLPYGRNTGDGNTPGGFYYLNYKINGDSNGQGSLPIRKYPNNILISGQISNSSVYGRDDFGYYWSSSGIFNCAYYLSLSKGSVGPGTSDAYRFRGLNVRCVAGN